MEETRGTAESCRKPASSPLPLGGGDERAKFAGPDDLQVNEFYKIATAALGSCVSVDTAKGVWEASSNKQGLTNLLGEKT